MLATSHTRADQNPGTADRDWQTEERKKCRKRWESKQLHAANWGVKKYCMYGQKNTHRFQYVV